MIALALLLATVTGNPPPAIYSCTGGTVYTIPFPYLAASQVIITQTTGGVVTTLAQPAGYTVKPASAPSTGTATLAVACPNGATLTISRNVPLTQPQGFRTSAYQGAAHEQAFDRIEMQAQQLNSSIQAEITARAALAAKEAADVAAAINPAPVTVNSSSAILATGATTSQTLAEISSYLLNVKAFGALGDGTTNDTTAFNNAIVAAAAAGKILYVPPGTYIVKNVTVASAVRIEGAGRQTATLKMPVEASLEGVPILNVTVANVTIRNLGFDGQKASQPADGFSDSFSGGLQSQGRSFRTLIKVYNAGGEIVGFTAEDCSFQNAYGAAIAGQNVSHAKIRRNYASNNNFELAWLSSTSATTYAGHEIVDNEILSTGSGHASINGNALLLHRATYAVVAHNYANGIERNFIKCESCTSTIIKGNTINNNTKDSFGGIQLQTDGSDVVISDNAITNCGAGVTVNPNSGAGYFNILISHNTINTTLGPTTGDGIAVNGGTAASEGISIVGNIMRGIVRYGVYTIGGPFTNAVISDNKIKTQGAAVQSGVLVSVGEAGHSGYSITGNVVDLGNVQSNGSGVYFFQSGGFTIANVSIIGNAVLTGAHSGFADSANVISSGIFADNLSDGYALFFSTNMVVFDSNLLRSPNGWMSPSQGRTALTTPVTVGLYDTRIITNLTVPGAVTVNLPALGAGMPSGRVLLVKDGKGDAAANNITIVRGTSTTIDGLSANKVINTNYGALHLVYDGTSNWITY